MAGFSAFDVAALPVELVGRLLGRTLAPGIVHFSAANQDHALKRHEAHFEQCMSHLEMTICSPHYIGQSPSHPVEFELVRETSAQFVLVAVTLGRDSEGRYLVQSIYPIGRNTVQNRIRTRHLFAVD